MRRFLPVSCRYSPRLTEPGLGNLSLKYFPALRATVHAFYRFFKGRIQDKEIDLISSKLSEISVELCESIEAVMIMNSNRNKEAIVSLPKVHP